MRECYLNSIDMRCKNEQNVEHDSNLSSSHLLGCAARRAIDGLYRLHTNLDEVLGHCLRDFVSTNLILENSV